MGNFCFQNLGDFFVSPHLHTLAEFRLDLDDRHSLNDYSPRDIGPIEILDAFFRQNVN